MFRSILILVFSFSVTFGFSQYFVTGKVVSTDNKPVMGAAVSIKDTYIATLTDKDGKFILNNLNEGVKTIVISAEDFIDFHKDINLTSDVDFGNLLISHKTSDLTEVEIFSDIVGYEKNTYPMVVFKPKADNLYDNNNSLNQISSVFSSTQGGGYGDMRLAIRGYGSDNIAFSLNGVQLNDPEDNKFNWALWQPLNDLSRSIVVEKGLGNTLLNNNAIGGSLKFVTDCHKKNSSIFGKVEYGSGNDMKYSFGTHSGLIKDKFAVSTFISYQNGDGLVDKTWNNVSSYYLGAYYKFNNNHSLDFFGFNSIQKHGQHLNMSNIAAYDYKLADQLAGDVVGINNGLQSESGVLFNSDWNDVNTSYTGQQYLNKNIIDRYSTDWMNSYESYSNMPLYNLLWNAGWSKMVKQQTSFYLIDGIEVNSRPFGDINHDATNLNLDIPDFDSAIANNISQSISSAVLVNNIAKKSIYGSISKFNFLWNRNFHSTAGIEYRGSKSNHYDQIRDLLGGEYFSYESNKYSLGEKLYSDYISKTEKFGAFINSDFVNDELAFNIMFGWSIHNYSFENLLKEGVENYIRNDNFYIRSDWYNAFQSKLGAKYTINETMGAYGNFGFVYSAPYYSQIFDVINSGYASTVVNPYYINYELGFNYKTIDDKFKSTISIFSSSANNEVNTISVVNSDTLNNLFYIPGIDVVRRGIEISLSYFPFSKLGLFLNTDFSDFKYQTDASGNYENYIDDEKYTINYSYNIINLKKGTAPQTKINFEMKYQPLKGLVTTFGAQYMGYYNANWNIQDRTSLELDENENVIQAWRIKPSTILNFGLNYSLPLKTKFGIDIFGNFNNILNTQYIIDAADNSPVGIYSIDSTGEITNSHSAMSSAVFMGLPLNFRVGMKVRL